MHYTEKNLSETNIKNALLAHDSSLCPLEELIATGDAAFAFIRQSDIDFDLKQAFDQLEKQYDFYKELVMK